MIRPYRKTLVWGQRFVCGPRLVYIERMFAIHRQPDLLERLELLSTDAQYDLACACSNGTQGTHRRRAPGGTWIYPVAMPGRGNVPILRTLLTNVCHSDCAYCPLRVDRDPRRTALAPEEVVRLFLHYLRRKEVFGLFLTSGMAQNPDTAMERMLQVVRALRGREGFRGYIHLKILPGCSDAAMDEAVRRASAVSLNIEVPGEAHFRHLSQQKRFLPDIIAPLKRLQHLTAPGSGRERVKRSTQFIVGAADETDAQLLKWMGGLYARLGLHRVYYNAYQRGLGSPQLPGEQRPPSDAHSLLTREHRLYQADFLVRTYGFTYDEIPTDDRGFLDLQQDPKALWAAQHPERFPVDVNRAPLATLLRVPGLGPTLAKRIVTARRQRPLRHLDELVRKPALRAQALPCLHIG